MDRASLLTLPPDVLRQRVVETVRRHWVTPVEPRAVEKLSAERVEELSRAALDTMLTRQYRVGPLPAKDAYDQLLDRVRRRVRKGKRIAVAIGYGPLKNQNAVPYSRADWAEFFALTHLAAWHNKVQAVYPPGLKLRIVFDDSTLVMANRADRRLMNSYITSIGELTRALGYDGLFQPTMRHSAFAWLLHFGFFQVARWRVRRWEKDPANRDQLDKMNAFARRNLQVPAGLSPEEQERYIQEASHRYRVYWEALQLSGLTKSKRRIVAMYLDGTQHHIRQSVALHLTTVDKGQVTQPWQGEGMLLDNGHGKLEPFVMTAGRRQRYLTQTLDGIDVVPMPGFEHLAVAASLEPMPAKGKPSGHNGTGKNPAPATQP